MKISFKAPPCDWYDIVGMERWYEKQAKKGWMLKKPSSGLTKFRKGPPVDIRYRMEPIAKKNDLEELQGLYEDAGWAYIGDMEGTFWVWRATRADAEELHTDPVVQSMTYERLCKRLIRSAWIEGAFTLCFLAIACYLLFSSAPVVELLVTGFFIYGYPMILILSFMADIARVFSIRRLKRMLAEGISIERDEKKVRKQNTKRHILYYGKEVLKIGYSLLVFGIIILYSSRSWRCTISEVEKPLPFLPLALVEDSDGLELNLGEVTVFPGGADGNDEVSYTWMPLVPERYYFYQSGQVLGRQAEDGSGIYQPVIETQYYRLAILASAVPLFEELVEENTSAGEALSHPYFDHVVVEKQAGETKLFACRGREVIYIRYCGEADLTERLDDLAESLRAVQIERETA